MKTHRDEVAASMANKSSVLEDMMQSLQCKLLIGGKVQESHRQSA